MAFEDGQRTRGVRQPGPTGEMKADGTLDQIQQEWLADKTNAPVSELAAPSAVSRPPSAPDLRTSTVSGRSAVRGPRLEDPRAASNEEGGA